MTMTIHLISDQYSFSISNFLCEFVSKFLPASIKFKLVDHHVENQDYWTWPEIFQEGKLVRSQNKISSREDFFIVLISGENEHNWFASFDPEDSAIGFIKTSGWDQYELKRPNLAIAYHLVTLLIAMRFFGNDSNPYGFYHNRSVGCMFDFTGFKEEVIYKLKSAHICPCCIQSIAKKSAGNPHAFAYIKGVKDLLENVRDNLFKVEWSAFFQYYDYQLIINENLSLDLKIDGEQIHLPISKGRESALFMMLLKYENGLTYDDFKKPQLKKEYLAIYHRYFVNNCSLEGLIKQADQEIKQKTFKSNLHANISKIKRKLTEKLRQYPEIRNQLLIQGGNGPLIIPIDRQRLVSRIPELAKVG